MPLRAWLLALGVLGTRATETRYGLVFDAGSSGSRVHVYSWHVGGGGPKDQFDLLKDDLKKVWPSPPAPPPAPPRTAALSG